ncbi:hypothetical protein K438DRAFT_1961746 [Mycena galopus ATCC 62051]|nr:hypothetical protein K438DRAFT_1961746 [Mycena galopus ATCC 62051]
MDLDPYNITCVTQRRLLDSPFQFPHSRPCSFSRLYTFPTILKHNINLDAFHLLNAASSSTSVPRRAIAGATTATQFSRSSNKHVLSLYLLLSHLEPCHSEVLQSRRIAPTGADFLLLPQEHYRPVCSDPELDKRTTISAPRGLSAHRPPPTVHRNPPPPPIARLPPTVPSFPHCTVRVSSCDYSSSNTKIPTFGQAEFVAD